MFAFHLFFDSDNRAIVIEDHPDALDRAPYDRIVRRGGESLVEPGEAHRALSIYGGVAIYADRLPVTITVKIPPLRPPAVTAI